MIKNLNKRKLSRTSSHRRALLRNMATSLFLHEKITTTYAKAREVSSFAEKLLTAARPLDVNARRRVFADIKDVTVGKKIFDVLIPRYEKRTSGRVAVYKAGHRKSDNAKMAIVALV
ncbi:MAG: 50S ribosomal protein L17 [Elusimicrobia bacterium HGW-Elusimicrobia-1]|nr:MAG: 50S ribosomal protein L17 [Elusimicrobia bacterium HGW-Elusimicrobia-1]